MHYMQPDPLTKRERLRAESIMRAKQPNPTAPAADAVEPAVLTTIEPAAPSPPPTVAMPSGPLLRNATEAPPLDTSTLDATLPVRHDLSTSPGLSAESGTLAASEQITPEAQPSPIARPAATRRSTKSRPTGQHATKTVEQILIHPLGTR